VKVGRQGSRSNPDSRPEPMFEYKGGRGEWGMEGDEV
jgi:hypothetical protein